MQKLSRSLIALGGLALLAACGDDVSITPPPEPTPATIAKVDVVPAQLTIKVGEKVILTASVTVNPGAGAPATTVTWESANTAIATVAATGEVTGVAPGTTSIRAISTADPTKIGAAAITVGAIAPATVSIKSVTTGTTNTPVNFNNVIGQIDVTLNVEPGDQTISAVEVLIDGDVACTQSFSGLKSAEEIEAALAEVVCSIQTNEFDPVTGAVTYLNGVHTLTARAQLVGGTSVATPSTNLTFNNQSGWIATVTNTGTNTGSPAAATNPTTGLGWTQGTHDLTLVGVNYAPGGVTFSSVNVNLFGVNTPLTQTAGTQSFTASFSAASTWNGTNLRLGNYMTAAAGGEAPIIIASTLSNGQAGATTLLNSTVNAPPLGLTPLAPIRVDNTAPGVTSANAIVQTPAVVGVMPLWVNATFSFVPTAVFTSGADIGSNSVTRTYYSIAGALPGAANSCTFTGMTAVTLGSDLAASTVSTTYSTRVADKDALGNVKCWDLTGTNGADFVAPTIVSLTGPADLDGFNAAPGSYVFSVTDNASGFGATPVTANISRVGITGATACVVAPTGTCTGGLVGLLPLTFDATNSTNVDGYYTISNWTVADQALNTTSVASRTFVLDQVAPTFSGGMSLQPLYTGNATATFNAAVADNLDLNDIYGVISYPTASFQYPTQQIGTYGVPLEQTANVTLSVANFMRCVNNPGDFVSTGNKANSVDLVVSDFGGNSTSFGGFAIPALNVETCGAVGNAAINTFGPTTVTYQTGKTQVDIDGASLAAASGTSATLSAIADVPINTSVDPFSRVDFYYWNGTAYVLIGTSTGVLAQTPTTRTYTYTFTWDPAAPVTAAVNTVVAIGVDSNGDAVGTGTAAILLVP